MSIQQELRKLYRLGGGRREFFDMLATYTRRRSELQADAAADSSGLAVETIVPFLKELGALKIGEFRYGRHGKKTRLIWNYSPRSVGEVAQGVSKELDGYGDDSAPEGNSDRESTGDGYDAPAVSAVSIADLLTAAKNDLAAKLGLKPEQIEITIKH